MLRSEQIAEVACCQRLRWTEIGQLASERLGSLDSGWVVKGENTKDITSLESGSWLLDELYNTIFLGDQRHVHLHHLNFSECLASLDVFTIVNSELDKLTGRWSSELSGVVLLLEQASLAVNTKASSSSLFLPVKTVGSSSQKHKQTTISKRSDTNRALGAVDEEVVAVKTGSGSGELVSVAFVDEIDGEDSLQNILRRDLTLLQAFAVFGNACLAGDVGLGDSTAEQQASDRGARQSACW